MTEVDLGRVVDSRRFIDLLPWQAEFLNTALVSEFTNRQALNKSGVEDRPRTCEFRGAAGDSQRHGARHSLSPTLAPALSRPI
jgi:hypothetical protein